MSEHALVVGWRVGAVPALERLGLRVTSVVAASDLTSASADGNGQVIAAADSRDVGQLLSALARARVDLADFDVVCSNLEESLVAASVLGRLADARALPVPVAVRLRDKVCQKAAVRAAGLPVANYLVVDRFDQVETIADPYPVVVKPPDGAGAKDTFLVASPAEARRMATELGADRMPGPWLVEEFIPGREVHLDGVVQGGTLLLVSVSRYLQNVIDIKSNGVVGSVLLQPEVNRELYDRAQVLAHRSVAAMDFPDGVFHIEAFEQPGRLVFSECAGRTGGGLIREMVRSKFGLDLVDAWAATATSRPVTVAAGPHDSRAYGMAHLICRPGRVESIPSAADLVRRPGVLEGNVTAQVGDRVPDFRVASNVRAGRFVVADHDEKTVTARLTDTLGWFAASTVVV